MAERNPLTDPIVGDLVEGPGGERRLVRVRRAGPPLEVVSFGVSLSGRLLDDKGVLRECSLSSWREWAQGGSILERASD